MTASRNYEFLNTGTRLNAYASLYRCTTLSCITVYIYSLPDFKNNDKWAIVAPHSQ